ncbi:hypothetical protein [Thalassorhabdomicrobium marinisediminis]|uniref:DUF2946 domain-containing protein n=1 Tax=Thalassorhabdomicrobium marinisediminis TaxID=2170577 RepID=A0A2T7FX05_9RHOB|nr:hypothetical protein [Thalassorhabdomicrobium marinisediminis]PVA06689.1 hypothetical protein DC363_09170 [Thalassorhabdomicrobium marinisediminis]
MTRLARFLSLTLALLVVLSTQQMAQARVQMANAAGTMVLCTGQGVVTVTVDRSGAPMDPPAVCPDCAITLAAAPATAPLPRPDWTLLRAVDAPLPRPALALAFRDAPRARAPPFPV